MSVLDSDVGKALAAVVGLGVGAGLVMFALCVRAIDKAVRTIGKSGER